jgi:superfamily II DNA/RNA helicase
MKSLGFSAVALTKETVRNDHTIWNKVDNGEYSIVFASPEILLNPRSHFWTVTVKRNTKFKKQLVTVAVDECHLIWDWKRFRPKYRLIGNLRRILSPVPWVCLSATLTRAGSAYIHRACKLLNGTILFKRTVRRRNINIQISAISSSDYEQLASLINAETKRVEDIPKTLIYVDNSYDALDIARVLRRRLGHDLGEPGTIVRTYFRSTDELAKSVTLKMVQDGRCRIAICTDAFGMGVDIPDILRVIQWDVDSRLNLNSLIQRIGRCARDPKCTGNAVIYVKPSLLSSLPRETPADDDSTSRGSSYRSPAPQSLDDALEEEYSDDDGEETLKGLIPKLSKRDLTKFRVPVTVENIVEVHLVVQDMFVDAKNLRHAVRLAHLTSKEKGSVKERMAGVYNIDPGILWMIATSGCRWRPSLMLYEDEEVLSEDHSGWCCDNCASAAGLDIRAGIPGAAPDGPDKVRTCSEKDPDADASLFFGTKGLRVIQWIPDRPPELCKARRGALLNAIVRWRHGVYHYLGLPSSISPSVVLPDKIVGDLVNNVSGITSKESLYQHLIKARVRINSTCITPIILSALFKVIDEAMLPDERPCFVRVPEGPIVFQQYDPSAPTSEPVPKIQVAKDKHTKESSEYAHKKRKDKGEKRAQGSSDALGCKKRKHKDKGEKRAQGSSEALGNKKRKHKRKHSKLARGDKQTKSAETRRPLRELTGAMRAVDNMIAGRAGTEKRRIQPSQTFLEGTEMFAGRTE